MLLVLLPWLLGKSIFYELLLITGAWFSLNLDLISPIGPAGS
jgi:hypothetical protein